MSPTLRDHRTPVDGDRRSGARAPRGAVVFAWSLLAIASVGAALLVARGESLPNPGLLLLLAVPLALCMNRYLFFPNEVGVTADAAVLFAAIVAFADQSPWLGPLLLALLVGPLDARHWGARAWSRMAYNSGSTALTTGAGVAVFAPLASAFGPGWGATLGAAALAAIPYIVVEFVLGVGLMALLGERVRDAVRHQVPLDSITLPLALVGAFAGLLAIDVATWSALVVLLPVPVVPELVVVVLPRRLGRTWSSTTALLVVGGACLALSVGLPGSTARAAAGLVALVCLVLAESRPDRATRVPRLLVLVVVATVAAFPELLPFTVSIPVGAVLLATVVGAALLIVVARPGGHAAWMAPVVAVAACVGRAGGMAGRFGALLFCTAMIATMLAASAWGPPPWRSRLIGPRSARARHARNHTTLLAVGILAVGAACATVALDGTACSIGALVAATLLEVEIAMAAFAVRMWRFAPRRRLIDMITLGVACVATLLIYLPLALDALVLSTVVAATCATTIGTVAWPLAIRARTDDHDARSFVPRRHEEDR